jgi:hypothetical protein
LDHLIDKLAGTLASSGIDQNEEQEIGNPGLGSNEEILRMYHSASGCAEATEPRWEYTCTGGLFEPSLSSVG